MKTSPSSLLPSNPLYRPPNDTAADNSIDNPSNISIPQPKLLTTPVLPSPKEREQHNVSHAEYKDWCPHCVSGRGRVTQHKRSSPEEKEERQGLDATPVLQLDYTFCATRHDPTNVQSILVVKDVSTGWIEAALLPKGNCAGAILFVRKVIDILGHRKLIIQTDSENAATSLAKNVASSCQNVFTRVAPKRSHQSQGSVERGIQTLQGLLRTHISSLEYSAQIKVMIGQPVFLWLIRHCCWLHNRFGLGPGGRSPFEDVFGRGYKGPLVLFGEHVQYLVDSERSATDPGY